MTNINDDAIGKLIDQLLETNKISISELAEQCGVSKVSVGQWIKGKRPSITNICKMADIFHITVDEIVEGKLHTEGTADYLNRNFNLSEIDLDDCIKKKDIDGVYEYLRRCMSIKCRFMLLVRKWGDDSLTPVEKEEFEYQRKYVRIDTRLFGDKYHYDFNSVYENKEDLLLKQCVKEYFDNIAHLREENEEAWTWEVDKLIEYKFDLMPKGIIDLGDYDLFTILIYLVNQQYRDELLEYNLKDKTKAMLSGNEYFGSLLDCGANYIYRTRSSHGYFEDDLFELLEGKIEEDAERTNASESVQRPGFDAAGRSQIYLYKDEWKTYSYDEYKKTVNTKRTKYLDDLCMVKYLNPVQYFKNLESGLYDDYFD